MREELEESFGNEYESLLVLMGHLRKEVLSRQLSQDENRRIFYELVNSRILEAIVRKDWNEVATVLSRITGTQMSSEEVSKIISQGSSLSTGET